MFERVVFVKEAFIDAPVHTLGPAPTLTLPERPLASPCGHGYGWPVVPPRSTDRQFTVFWNQPLKNGQLQRQIIRSVAVQKSGFNLSSKDHDHRSPAVSRSKNREPAATGLNLTPIGTLLSQSPAPGHATAPIKATTPKQLSPRVLLRMPAPACRNCVIHSFLFRHRRTSLPSLPDSLQIGGALCGESGFEGLGDQCTGRFPETLQRFARL